MTNLYVVGTPIGNLKDITLRAIETLSMVNIVICEDTRVTGKLLNHLNLSKKMISLNAFNEKQDLQKIISKISEVSNVALVSDAGTPTISDPGCRLVRFIRENYPEIKIEVIPGPSALISALSISGVPASDFVFLGFLPHKKGRETSLNNLVSIKSTVVLYESNHRILKLLESLKNKIGNRKLIIARELTKKFEETIEGNAGDVFSILNSKPEKQKGEFVVVVFPQGFE
jgi:16S rRNA (cytidine1402-2'-O)-methyltransferase